MRAAWNRFRDLLRRDALAREMDEELGFHRAMLERDGRTDGLDGAGAARRARRRLGNLTRLNEELRAMWGFAWMDEMARNVRYGARSLAKSPGFAIAVIITLGLGIGANAALFSVIDRLMFRPYPYMASPDRVDRVYLQWDQRAERRTELAFEYARFADLRRWTSSFDLAAAIAGREMAVGSGEATRERQVDIVSGSFWDFFDARPALGRFFVAAEDTTPRGAEVVVLGYDFWQSEMGGRRDVIGQVLQVGNVPSVIIGVAPRGFTGVDDRDAAVYVPMTTYAGSMTQENLRNNYYTRYDWGWLSMMVRRKPGVTRAQASADLSVAYARSWEAERALSPGLPPSSLAHPAAIAGALKVSAGPRAGLEAKTALWVAGVALIVLLIACANVANLYLARTIARRREVAVRLALGVNRRRLVGQFLTESIGLALCGCVAGIALAQWGGAAMRAVFTPDDGTLNAFTDVRTILAAIFVSVGAGVLTGLAPLVVSSRGDLAGALKAGAREGTLQRSRLRTVLIVAQGALSVTLLVGAGLFMRSLANARALRLGYDADQIVLATGTARGVTLSNDQRVALGRRLLSAAQALPGVDHAAWVSAVPFFSTNSMDLFVPGIDSVRKLGRFTYTTGTPDYFAAMGTRILRGRAFDSRDRAGTQGVVVVSEGMAHALWPGEDAIGKCIRLDADTVPCTTVIGVSEDMVERDLTGAQHFSYFLPSAQFQPEGGFVLVVRARGDAAALEEPLRRRLQTELTGASYASTERLSTFVDRQRRSWEIGATMFAAFGLLALAVAAVGMYGVISYNVAQRRQELGVRVALGADRASIMRLVVGQATRVGAAGIVLGSLGSLLAARFVQPLLFRQSPTDPLVYGVVAAVLLATSVVASALPAFRATRVDPNEALRAE
ncbi:MAG TPA: ABC transporter permease [Gemmatimonadaceae bacterium]|nr:ABC transporter permease [Gemmatimonadaceae bacterium]